VKAPCIGGRTPGDFLNHAAGEGFAGNARCNEAGREGRQTQHGRGLGVGRDYLNGDVQPE
jgi:hypothetical protein